MRSRRLAGVLRARGLRRGDRLAVQLANRLELVELFLACLELGVVFVPVNVLYREREVGHIVADAQPRAVVTTPELAPLVPTATETWDVDALAAAASREPDAATAARPTGDAPAAIVYTSGTTGRAKGAVLTHANLAANALTLVDAWRITAADRYLAVLPLFHVHGLANGVGCWLASGCRMRLVERFEHATAQALLEEFQPTLFFGVPTVYVRLLELPDAAARAIGARTRLFVSGSAPLPAAVFDAFRARFGHAILERYGMTETLMTLGNPYEGERRPGTRRAAVRRRLDPHRRPGRSRREGRRDGRAAGARPLGLRRLLATAGGDAGRLRRRLVPHGRPRRAVGADGYVTLRGRASELILCGGFNVYPREIEDLLRRAARRPRGRGVGTPDARRGERPLAFYVGDADAAALEAACRRQLASFKVPPAFVRVDALPAQRARQGGQGRAGSSATLTDSSCHCGDSTRRLARRRPGDDVQCSVATRT